MAEEYAGEKITIRFDGDKCIHSRNCVLGLPNVFQANVPGPWINPDNGSVEELIAVARSCPSGAITYERHDGGEAEREPDVNVIRVLENGSGSVEDRIANEVKKEIKTFPNAKDDKVETVFKTFDEQVFRDPSKVPPGSSGRLYTTVEFHFKDPDGGSKWRGMVAAVRDVNKKARFLYIISVISQESLWDELDPVFSRLLGAGTERIP